MGTLMFFDHSGKQVVHAEIRGIQEMQKEMATAIAKGGGFTVDTEFGVWAFPEEFVRSTFAFIKDDETAAGGDS